VLENAGMRRRVGVEVRNRALDAVDVARGVSAEQHFFRGGLGRPPFPVRVAGFQERNCFPNPIRAFRMPGRGVFNAPGIVENDHGYPQDPAVTNRKNRLLVWSAKPSLVILLR
jgi:hypothetical protein